MKYSKITTVLLAFLIVFAQLNIFATAAEEDPEGQTNAAVTNGCHTLDAATTYLGSKILTDNVSAAVVYETNSDTLMYAQNADEKMYPSSLTKVLTALIAVEKGKLDDVITIRQDVLDTVPYYAASAELVAGEKISLSDLLYCMMVGSANDAAAVIATHICGTQDAFVQEMNNYASSLGCTNTQFVNVHGLHDQQQYTTARDMARIVAAAVENEAFLTYFSAVRYDVPPTNKSELRELSSGNFLMNIDNMQIYFDARVTGGRTGVTEDGLRCMATLAQQDTMQLICVVMGSKDTFADDGKNLSYGSFKETSALLDAALNGYKVVQILHEGQILKQCQVMNGQNDVILGALSPSYSVLPVNVTVSDLSYQFADIAPQFEVPIASGQQLSRVEVWYGSLCVGQTDLVALNSVQPIAVQQQLEVTAGNNNRINITVVVIVSIVIGAVVLLLILRFAKKIPLVSRRTRQYRRSRRRSR